MKTMPTQKKIRDNTNLLFRASQHGDLDDVQRLLPLSDPKARGSEALSLAAANGHTECVKLLIPVSNPNDRYSLALQYAVMHKHIDIIKLLIPVSHYQWVLTKLIKENIDIGAFQQCVDEYEALLLKERLQNKLKKMGDNQNKSLKRKM